MITIRKKTKNYDYNFEREEILNFRDWEQVEHSFWYGYVRELKNEGHFTIRYSQYGDPRNADPWNGEEIYELVK